MIQKRIRHYYWLFTGFIKKHIALLIISFIAAFFLIIFFLNFFPFFSSVIFQHKQIIGLIGTYTTQNIPQEIKSQISNPLITIDQNGDIQLVLAHSWELLDNGQTYRFHLRNDLYWSDQQPFTAYDLNYKFQDVETVPVDDYTIEFRLQDPLNIFPIYLTQPVIRNPLTGIGALYTVDSFKSNKNILESVSLKPNKSNLPYKIYKFYNSEEDLINAYKKGEITYFESSNVSVADVFSDWNNTNITKSVDFDQVMALFMNTQSGPLQERDVRKAIAFATPSFPENGEPAKSPIPPTSWAYFDDLKEYPFNEERATGLIENNITASDSASMTLHTFFDYIDTAEVIQDNLEKAGLDIDLKVVSSVPDDYDLFLSVWNPPKDPDQYFFWHSTQDQTNITQFNNAKVDKLLEDGRRVINVKQRENIYAELQETLAEEVPAYFMYHPFTYEISRK